MELGRSLVLWPLLMSSSLWNCEGRLRSRKISRGNSRYLQSDMNKVVLVWLMKDFGSCLAEFWLKKTSNIFISACGTSRPHLPHCHCLLYKTREEETNISENLHDDCQEYFQPLPWFSVPWLWHVWFKKWASWKTLSIREILRSYWLKTCSSIPSDTRCWLEIVASHRWRYHIINRCWCWRWTHEWNELRPGYRVGVRIFRNRKVDL